MKTKIDIRALKEKHRLELVMQETGEIFRADASTPDQWRSTITPGLVVDVRRQLFEINTPGMDMETGDVLKWLQLRYSWTFPMAIKFLQNRMPDPKIKIQPAQITKSNRSQFLESDFIKRGHVYINPTTGQESYGVTYNREIMDNLQQRALDIAGEWAIKYFTKSSHDIWEKLNDYPHRFKEVVDFEIKKCARCETEFNWQSPDTSAWACEEKQYLEVISDVELMRAEEEIYLDIDFVICKKCRISEYAPRYKALELIWKSACRREQAEQEEQAARDRAVLIRATNESDLEDDQTNNDIYLKEKNEDANK